MFDPIGQSLAAAGACSVYAAPLVFLAGAVSSVGPCVAPRFVAVAGMAAGRSRRETALLVAAFVGGLTAAYAAFGAASSLAGTAARYSAFTYAAVAAALAAGGMLTLWREQRTCSHGHRAEPRSAGGALLLGASFALVVSPCCTPLVLGIAAYTSGTGGVAYAGALLACFALGHALPIVAVAFGVNGAGELLRRHAVQQAAGVVSATLMLGLAAYYAVLA